MEYFQGIKEGTDLKGNIYRLYEKVAAPTLLEKTTRETHQIINKMALIDGKIVTKKTLKVIKTPKWNDRQVGDNVVS